MNALRYICIFEHLVEVGKMRSPFMKAKIARKKCDRFGVSKVKFNIKIPGGMKNFPYDSVSHLGSNYRFGVSKVKIKIKIPSGMKNFPYDSVSHLGSN